MCVHVCVGGGGGTMLKRETRMGPGPPWSPEAPPNVYVCVWVCVGVCVCVCVCMCLFLITLFYQVCKVDSPHTDIVASGKA